MGLFSNYTSFSKRLQKGSNTLPESSLGSAVPFVLSLALGGTWGALCSCEIQCFSAVSGVLCLLFLSQVYYPILGWIMQYFSVMSDVPVSLSPSQVYYPNQSWEIQCFSAVSSVPVSAVSLPGVLPQPGL